MPRRKVDELIVPAEQGRAFKVRNRQTVRVIAIEGPQVADVTFLNTHDYKETYDGQFSYLMNARWGSGNAHKMKYLLSRLPRANLMAEITDDPVGRHWVINAGHCNAKSNELRGLPPTARSCHGNIAEALEPFGLTADRVPHTFPLWMNVDENPNGLPDIKPSLAKQGDYIDYLAHMDLLVAISACPGNQPDAKVFVNLNDGVNRPLKVEVWEGFDL